MKQKNGAHCLPVIERFSRELQNPYKDGTIKLLSKLEYIRAD